MPLGKARAARAAFAWFVADLGLSPVPGLRFVARVTDREAARFEAVGRAVHRLSPSRGFVRSDSPDEVFVSSEADLGALAHEARHVWQARRWPNLAFHKGITDDVEADAQAYASSAVERYREHLRLERFA